MWFHLGVLLIIVVGFAESAPFVIQTKSPNSINNYISKTRNSGRISERKCTQYVRDMSTTYYNRQRRIAIYNGKTSNILDYPHMGALGWRLRNNSWIFLCGSSLISPNFVLTAAHCTKIPKDRIDVSPTKPIVVRLGTTNIREPQDGEDQPITINIKQMIPHTNYHSPVKYYDIMLVELEKPVQFTRFVHPACLSRHLKVDINKQHTVSGWGVTKEGPNIINYLSPVLRSTQLDIFKNSECDILLESLESRNWNLTRDHQLCAGKLDGSTDTCAADSGSPLQHILMNTKNVKMHTIVGITAFGKGCAKKNHPGVYTKVSHFLDWIEEKVWPEDVLMDSKITFSPI